MLDSKALMLKVWFSWSWSFDQDQMRSRFGPEQRSWHKPEKIEDRDARRG